MIGAPASRFVHPVFFIAAYAALLLAAILTIPLRVPEILQMAGSVHFSIRGFTAWTVTSPDIAPLHYFLQLPFLLVLGHSRLAARLLTYFFALGACSLFLEIVRDLRAQFPYFALLLFMLLPAHLLSATEARPHEQALFLLLVATLFYFRLIAQPSVRLALLYGGSLLLCLFTDADSYLPAIGYLLFLFRFVSRPQERRALWFALPATAAPWLLFLPYYLWAHPQVNPDWPLSSPAVTEGTFTYLQALRGFPAPDWIAYVTFPLIAAVILASLAATWNSGPRIPR